MKLRTVCSEKQIVLDNNIKMVIVVEECEKTLSQLVEKKGRDEACWQILIERLAKNRVENISSVLMFQRGE